MNKFSFKIALGVEYNGSYYHGWQIQAMLPSIQEKVEYALSIIANHVVHVVCAGRTDAGVHSTGQVIHFCTNSIRTDHSWIIGTNRYLPKDICIIWKKEVPWNFHARYSAISRRYRYIIYNNYCRSSIFYHGLNYFYKKLDINKMNKSAQVLIGQHDFTSFRSSYCQSRSPIRKIFYLNIFSIDCLVIIDIEANSFLHHMVRNIVGCLIEVGISKQSESWIESILILKNRSLAAPTAKSNGLYLVQVKYSTKFNIPANSIGPFFLNSHQQSCTHIY